MKDFSIEMELGKDFLNQKVVFELGDPKEDLVVHTKFITKKRIRNCPAKFVKYGKRKHHSHFCSNLGF